MNYCPGQCSVSQLVGALFCNQKVAGSIPSHGTCLGCGFNSQSVGIQSGCLPIQLKGNQSVLLSHTDVFSLPSSLSKSNEKNMSSSKDFKKKFKQTSTIKPQKDTEEL